MRRNALIALTLMATCLPAAARPKTPPKPIVSRLNADENAYTYHNYRYPAPARATPVSTSAARGQASYNRSYAHIIPPDGFGPIPNAYSLGPGWANRWGSYSSGSTDFPYNAGGYVNSGFFNGGFYPGGVYSYPR
ncbi:MAG: hypothetical protein KF760_22960 [Candidatus Eremiobacteraeota bacterium]|nr:hypothetical protein [Candidatus Eremiobacteraeota bacterium]MCW5868372.1 hypothetical protein [Candidatus Eremiobacteraeota bacterium]